MRNVAAKASFIPRETDSDDFMDFVDRMEAARSLIEERFLDGGAALLSILDVLNKLIGSLDQLNGSLDEGTARETMVKLTGAMDRLSQITRVEGKRQEGFQEIVRAERELEPQIDDMQETLRYLRTFALTAKITGAGIADFAGFAEEILSRIQEGTKQVNEFAGKVRTLGNGLGPVIRKSSEIVVSYNDTIPQILQGLSGGADDLSKHRKLLGERAASVRKVAGGIQTKLASILSAMQVGDISRQRIEHCQSSLQILSQYLESPAGGELNEEQRESLSLTIRKLVSLQLDRTILDFDRDTAKIVATVASFRTDLSEIESLRSIMTEGSSGENQNAIRQLETGIAKARKAVREIEDVSNEASTLSRNTAGTVRELLDGIVVVRAVRTDIHYMALNTNLRCSKIGEEGKAINVVTAELRHFAAQLDETAEKILAELQTLEGAAQQLIGSPSSDRQDSLDAQLEHVLDNLRTAGDRMDTQMAAINEQSRTALIDIDASLRRLDFNDALGDVLRECASRMETSGSIYQVQGLDAAVGEIGDRISRLYTMAAERELHAEIMGTAVPPAAVTSAVMTDDDIDDALF